MFLPYRLDWKKIEHRICCLWLGCCQNRRQAKGTGGKQWGHYIGVWRNQKIVKYLVNWSCREENTCIINFELYMKRFWAKCWSPELIIKCLIWKGISNMKWVQGKSYLLSRGRRKNSVHRHTKMKNAFVLHLHLLKDCQI
jgi:hypothetical protein